MANIINAITSGAGGLSTSADSSGILNIQSAGTTVAAIASTGMAVTGTGSVSGDLSFNSGYGSAAVAYGCRAWVNFDGTGTPAIRASGNVTSITDNGTGDYTVNFTNAMPDANYSVVASCDTYLASNTPTVLNTLNGGTYSTSAVRVITTYSFTTAYQDVPKANISIFR
jgi:hypothetical protein